MTINFSPLSWAVRQPGQDARIQARKERVSLTTVLKMGFLLERCPDGRQVLATWKFGVVPSGLPLRSTNMSLDMRLLADSVETAESVGPKPRLWN
jgi:hypothetical protein